MAIEHSQPPPKQQPPESPASPADQPPAAGSPPPQEDAANRGERPLAAVPSPAAEPPAAVPPPVAPAPDVARELAGLRAWLAQLDRKLGVRTYVGAALAILALAASGVAVYLALRTDREAASKDDITTLRERVDGVGQQAAGVQDQVNKLNEPISRLQKRLTALENKQKSTATQLSQLQAQGIRPGGGSGAGGGRRGGAAASGGNQGGTVLPGNPGGTGPGGTTNPR